MRLFIAVEPSLALSDWVAAAVRELQPRAPSLRWVPPANAHLTLVFMGETPDQRLDGLIEAAGRVAARQEPFTLGLGGLGAFDSWKKVRVIWTGVVQGLDPLRAVACALRAELRARQFPVEEREFSGHLTLARAREPKAQAELETVLLPPAPAMEVKELSLMRSHLHSTGARYEPLQRFPLKGDTCQHSVNIRAEIALEQPGDDHGRGQIAD